MAEAAKTYLPAAGHDWALPLYDPFVKLLGGDRLRRVLIEQAAIRPGHRVLEIGCGTGSLIVDVKRQHPSADVVGLDPDAKALARARRKAERRGVTLELDQAFSNDMPYADGLFDLVLSSFMFHHLDLGAKQQTLREVRRVLKPGGGFHMLDFASSTEQRGLSRWLHSSAHLRDNAEERVLGLMRQAGLADAVKVSEGSMLFGHMAVNYYQASR